LNSSANGYGTEHSVRLNKARQFISLSQKHMNNTGTGIVYGLGFIGAAVYYLQTAPTIGTALLGLLQAIFWPAFLVYNALSAFSL